MALLATPGRAEARSRSRPDWLDHVKAARGGDREAFAALHAQFCGLVHAVIIARVPATEASDLTQDVFVSMMQKLSTLEDEQAFPAWLLAVARTRAAKFLRDTPRHEELPEDLPHAAQDRSGWPDAKKVLAALHALPEAYAETLAMRLVEGMSGPEIAERTGLAPGSVRVNLHRGMARLREKLGLPARGEDPPDE